VLYQNIQGTSASDVAINFSCSKDFPCEGIVLQSVNIKREGAAGAAAKASCNNVKLSETGAVAPPCP